MRKNKYFMFLLIIVFLTLLLWVIVNLVTKAKNPVPPAQVVASELTPVEQVRISPANILSVVQLGELFTVKGTGVSESTLSLYRDGEKNILATALVNEEGEWELEFKALDVAGEFVARLLMVLPNGQQIRSDQSLVFVQQRLFPENEGETFTTSGNDGQNKTLILLSAPGSNSRVLQTPFVSLPGKKGFVLEAVDYDNSGGVIFSGLSVQMGKVRIYANGNFVGESSVNSSGRWNLIFGNVMPMGRYDIGVELVYTVKSDTDESEVEDFIPLRLPFSRMPPILGSDDNNPEIIVEYLKDRIQVGQALYGGGYQFTVIYSPQALIDIVEL